MTFRTLICLMLFAQMNGCTALPASSTGLAGSSQYVPMPDAESVSLFPADTEVLSDQEIARILAHEYRAPGEARIGVLALNDGRWQAWSGELETTTSRIRDDFVKTIVSSKAASSASYLPGLLVPKERTVGHFREAAARYQADMLLIYQPVCHTYAKYRVFSANTSRSYCTVESVLLDTRTGIVPFTTTVSREFTTDAADSEISFQETLRRAELGAIADSLSAIALEVVEFLDGSSGS